MSFYSELQVTAREMLTEFGQPVTVTRTEMGVPDLGTGVVPQLTTEFAGIGILFNYIYRSFGDGLEMPSTVTKSTKRLFMTVDKEIHPKDSVQVDGVVYQIVVIKLLNPAGTKILYDLQIEQ
jgi:hypothetical protein